MSLLVLCSTTVPVAVVGTVLAMFLFAPLPAALPEARAAEGSQFSTVLDAFGNQIAVFREFEQNIPVKEKDVPQSLKDAVVAAEDKRFYHHGGVDLQGSLRALSADIRNQGYVQGGSTITQQYVKNAYTNKKRTLVRKVREAVLARDPVQVPVHDLSR